MAFVDQICPTSKSSEEDSAYAGFGSTSPASSTQSSMSLQSTSSKSFTGVESQNLKPAPTPVECEPSSSTKPIEKKAPPVPCRSGSRVETTFECTPPAMPPIRQPPAYQQLVDQGRIHRSRLVVYVVLIAKTLLEHDAMACQSRSSELRDEKCAAVSVAKPSGYISEGGIAIYEKMQARLREYRDSMRRGHLDYNDSYTKKECKWIEENKKLN
ncbi:hypothetical protein NECAME_10141 [Necator americanus]|uniref:Uncharacterized protein n=1 Tax=Necator americanus TaxID=51031 RepID=W2TB38_NECAM|nr:hypothetical protein NECAME_10141 [Necator americanus]ETN78779.1 hypothetical protein NECAME_10141 [Necator americanus]